MHAYASRRHRPDLLLSVLAEWSVAYGHYVARAARRSASIVALQHSILERAARGARVDAVAMAQRSDQAAGGSDESRSPSDVSRDLNAVYDTFQEQLSAMGARALNSLAAIASTPLDDPAPLAFLEPELVGAVTRVCFDFVDRLDALQTESAEAFLRGVLGAQAADSDGAVTLRGPVGERVCAELAVQNLGGNPRTISAVFDDVRRDDGIGPAFAPALAVEPNTIALAPGGEGLLQVSLLLDETRYESGATYVGQIRFLGASDGAHAVMLRIVALPATTPEAHGAGGRPV